MTSRNNEAVVSKQKIFPGKTNEVRLATAGRSLNERLRGGELHNLGKRAGVAHGKFGQHFTIDIDFLLVESVN